MQNVQVTHDDAGTFFTVSEYVYNNRPQRYWQIVRSPVAHDQAFYRIPGTGPDHRYVNVGSLMEHGLHELQMVIAGRAPLPKTEQTRIIRMWEEYLNQYN